MKRRKVRESFKRRRKSGEGGGSGKEMKERVAEKKRWKIMKGRRDHSNSGEFGRREKEMRKMKVEGMDCQIK